MQEPHLQSLDCPRSMLEFDDQAQPMQVGRLSGDNRPHLITRDRQSIAPLVSLTSSNPSLPSTSWQWQAR